MRLRSTHRHQCHRWRRRIDVWSRCRWVGKPQPILAARRWHRGLRSSNRKTTSDNQRPTTRRTCTALWITAMRGARSRWRRREGATTAPTATSASARRVPSAQPGLARRMRVSVEHALGSCHWATKPHLAAQWPEKSRKMRGQSASQLSTKLPVNSALLARLPGDLKSWCPQFGSGSRHRKIPVTVWFAAPLVEGGRRFGEARRRCGQTRCRGFAARAARAAHGRPS